VTSSKYDAALCFLRDMKHKVEKKEVQGNFCAYYKCTVCGYYFEVFQDMVWILVDIYSVRPLQCGGAQVYWSASPVMSRRVTIDCHELCIKSIIE